MKQTKAKPERTCIVCRKKKDKRELARIVRNKEGEIFYDPTGKANGRGAYICRDAECMEKFLKKGNIQRAFRVSLDAGQAKQIKQQILEALDSKNAENEGNKE